ncbi:MAG: O-antigen ligase family protein [Candidatus Hodarchaeota archaeon]
MHINQEITNKITYRPSLKIAFLCSLLGFLIGMWVLRSPEIATAMTLIVVASFLIFKNPYVGLMLFILHIYLNPRTLYFQSPLVEHLGLPIVLITWLFYIMKVVIDRQPFPLKGISHNLVFLLIIFGSSIFISWVFASKHYEPGTLFSYTKTIIIYFIFILIVDSEIKLTNIIWSIIIVGTVAACFGLVQRFFFDIMYGDIRTTGLFHDSNYFGLYLIMPFILSFQFIFDQRRKLLRVFFSICSAICLLVIVSSLSRATWLAVSVAIGLLFLRSGNKKGFFYFSILAVLFILALNPQIFVSRLDDIFVEQSTLYWRIDVCKAGLKMFKENWVTGVGPGNFKHLVYSYLPGSLVGEDNPLAHNTFLTYFVEMGLLGGSMFILIAIFAWRNFRIAQKNFSRQAQFNLTRISQSLEASLIGIVIALASITANKHYIFWIIVAFSTILVNVSNIPKNTSHS